MNKLLLVSLACLMLLAKGDDGVAKKMIDAPKPTASTGEESGRTNSEDRMKRMPVTKESDSLGYAWNIGSGVSYMKINVGKDRLSGEVEGLRAAQHQVEHSLRVDHVTDQHRVKADITTGHVSALEAKLKNDNYLRGRLDLDKSRTWGNAGRGLKIIGAENWGTGHQKHHFKGLNFETNGFSGNKLKEVKHLDVSLHEFGAKENEGKHNFGSYKVIENHKSEGGLSTLDNVNKETILVPSSFSEEESKTRSNYETTEEQTTINGYGMGKSGKDKAGNDKHNIGGLGFQGSDLRQAHVFNVDYITGNGRTEHELGGKHIPMSSSYDSAHKINELEQLDFGFKGLNFGEYGFLLENNNKENGGVAIQYVAKAEQNPGVGHPSSGAEIKQLRLNQGEVKLEEKERNNAYFPTAYYNGYSHGSAQGTQDVKSFHQDKLNFGGTALNSGSVPSRGHEDSDDREIGNETKEYYASFSGENNEDGNAATEHIESNMEKRLVGHRGHENNGKPYIHPKIKKPYIGVINPTRHLPHKVISFGVNHPFSQQLISEQTGRNKQSQDNSFISASDGQLVGTSIYSILDGKAQSDARNNGYSFQGNLRNSIRNGSYHTKGVDGPYSFKIGVFGLNDESMNRDRDELNSSEVKNGNEETYIEGGKKVMNDANLENHKGTSYSYSNVRHALGESNEHAPYWKGRELHHHFGNNHNLGERSFPIEPKKNSPIDNKYDAVEGRTLWRKQRFSGKFIAEPSPTQFNSGKRDTSENDREEQTIKSEKKEVVNDKKPRDDRKGREAKNDDLCPKVRGKYSYKQSLGNAGVDHLFASSTIAKNTLEDDEGGEKSHLEENEEEHHKAGVAEHHERDYSEHYHFSFHKEPEVREITKAIPVHKEIKIPVPQMVHHPILIPFPVKILEPFPIKIPYPVPVEKTVQVPVEKLVPYPVEKPVPVKIIKKVPVPVPKPYPVKVPVYKVKYIHHKKMKQQY